MVRKIATAVDWSCEVKTLFREKNLSCKKVVSSGITWLFEREEQGIILEDDVLPDQSFFIFAEHMSEKYSVKCLQESLKHLNLSCWLQKLLLF